MPARSAPASAMTPILRPAIGPGSVTICDRAGDRRDVGGRAAVRGGQAEAGGDLGAQVGVDVGQHRELAFLDGLLVALAELEGERLDDVGLLQRRQAAVEHRAAARSGRRTRPGWPGLRSPSTGRGTCT